jgi:hypothetical protein
MFAVAVGMVATGVVCGAVARDRVARVGAGGHAALRREAEARAPAERAIAPPLPLLPRYGATLPAGGSLVWHLIDGTDGAEVEIAPTPDFAPEKVKRLVVDGETVKLPATLGAGVWFWRLRGVSDGVVGDRTTPTWMLDVAAAPSDATWG